MEGPTHRLTCRKLLSNRGCSTATPNGSVWPIKRIDELCQRGVGDCGFAHRRTQPILIGFMGGDIRCPLCGKLSRRTLQVSSRPPRACLLDGLPLEEGCELYRFVPVEVFSGRCNFSTGPVQERQVEAIVQRTLSFFWVYDTSCRANQNLHIVYRVLDPTCDGNMAVWAYLINRQLFFRVLSLNEPLVALVASISPNESHRIASQ